MPNLIESSDDSSSNDEYDVEEVLEDWLEFLQVETISDSTTYKFYHDNFRQWLIKSLF